MKTAYILTCKDLKRILPFAAAWSVLLFMSFACKVDTKDTLFVPMLFASITAWCVWMFSFSIIVHKSTPSGTTEFWMTRPISGFQLFTSKLLTVFLVSVLLPLLMLALLKAAGLTGSLNINGEAPKIISLFQTLVTAALFFMLLASLTQSPGQYFFLICGLFIAMAISQNTFMRHAFSPGQRHAIQHLDILEWTTTILYFPGLLFIIYNQYARRNRKTTALLSALLALLIFCLWQFWPAIPKT